MNSLVLLCAALVASSYALIPRYSSHGLFNPSKLKSDGIEYCVPDRVKMPFVGQIAISPAEGSPQVYDQKFTAYADFNKRVAFVYQELTPSAGKTIKNRILINYKQGEMYLYDPERQSCIQLNVTQEMIQCIPKDNKIIDKYTTPDHKTAIVIRYDGDSFLGMNEISKNTEIQVTTVFQKVYGRLTPFTQSVDFKDAKGNSGFQVLSSAEMSTRFSDDVFKVPDYC